MIRLIGSAILWFLLATSNQARANWQEVETWADEQILTQQALQISNNLYPVRVAVIDTGIDTNHPDLKGHVYKSWNFVSNSPSAMDDHGHGTHIAGIILKLAPNAQILNLKYYETSLPGILTLRNSIQALEMAVKENVDIINYSGGGYGYSEEEHKILKVAEAKGILVIAAAGNEASNTDMKRYYPADYRLSNIMSITAISEAQKLVSSSNFGAHSVDLAAPGENILSTLPKNEYGSMTGTSQATAYVSGVAALMLSNRKFSHPSKVIEHLVLTADEAPALFKKTKRQSILNAFRALSMKQTLEDIPFVPSGG